ncbi:MAG TPA: hypothetical protein PLU30_11925 [Verrucomicrobiae bacterium]|nr:hypothetical protein [Verrucomicrobiae bacterium]
MTDGKDSGIKSAFDLAMARLEKRDGKMATLSDEQKRAIAEVESKARAKTAEAEIMFQQKRRSVQDTGDSSQIEEVERQLRSELDKINRQAEAEKERIRRG